MSDINTVKGTFTTMDDNGNIIALCPKTSMDMIPGLEVEIDNLHTAVEALGPDTTLSVEGKAADAKVVGDAIENLKNVTLFQGISKCGESIAIAPNSISNIVYANGKFVACSTSANKNSYYSEDGINWIEGSLNSKGVNKIIYANGKFVGASNGGYTLYSEDGINWIEGNQITTVSSTAINLVYGNGMFVAASTHDGIYCSEDGINWTKCAENKYNYITYGDGKFIASGTSGYLYYSEDAANWTSLSIPVTGSGNYYGLTYADGKFLGVSINGFVCYSEDGINWFGNAITDAAIKDIAYGDGYFFTVDIEGNVFYSIDCVKWIKNETIVRDDSLTITSIVYGDGKFVIAGNWNGAFGYCLEIIKEEKLVDSALNGLLFINDRKALQIGTFSGTTNTSGNLVTTLTPNDVMITSAYRSDAAGMVTPFVDANGCWNFRVLAVSTSVAIVKSTAVTIKYYYHNV